MTCDNCGGTCDTVVKDSTLVKVSTDQPFAWGVECPCGIRRREEERTRLIDLYNRVN